MRVGIGEPAHVAQLRVPVDELDPGVEAVAELPIARAIAVAVQQGAFDRTSPSSKSRPLRLPGSIPTPPNRVTGRLWGRQAAAGVQEPALEYDVHAISHGTAPVRKAKSDPSVAMGLLRHLNGQRSNVIATIRIASVSDSNDQHD